MVELTLEQSKSFVKPQKQLVTNGVIAHPPPGAEIRVMVDVSNIIMSSILHHVVPFDFFSRKLQSAEGVILPSAENFLPNVGQ